MTLPFFDFTLTFLAANRLWFLLVVAVLAAVYLMLLGRRRRYALRFSSSELFQSIASSSPGFRRHLPAALFLLAMAGLVLATAKPATPREVERERATLIIAIDVSLSMEASDVRPSRLEAAQAAAIEFIDELPPKMNVGLVSFAGTAAVLVPPTQDHALAKRAVEGLELAESTAIGEAIFTSLDALKSVPADSTGEPPPASIVLLSDGETTVGRADSDAVAEAVSQDVPISTIAFGTAAGFILYDDPNTPTIESDRIPVPVSESNLRRIAEDTEGTFFAAATVTELTEVYTSIGSAVGTELVDQEVTDLFALGALGLFGLAAVLSLLWFQRLP